MCLKSFMVILYSQSCNKELSFFLTYDVWFLSCHVRYCGRIESMFKTHLCGPGHFWTERFGAIFVFKWRVVRRLHQRNWKVVKLAHSRFKGASLNYATITGCSLFCSAIQRKSQNDSSCHSFLYHRKIWASAVLAPQAWDRPMIYEEIPVRVYLNIMMSQEVLG